MKIGILTFHRSINYGAFIQAFSLQQLLTNSLTEHTVEIIDYDSTASDAYYRNYLLRKYSRRSFPFFKNKKKTDEEIEYVKLQRFAFRKAMKNHMILSKESLISDNIEEFNNFIKNKYDIIVVGSDEVWKIDGIRGFPNAYWLPDTNNIIKVAYSVSSRNKFESLSQYQIALLSRYINDFSIISVRDNCTRELINKIDGTKELLLSCDPTLAYSFKPNKKRGLKLLAEKYSANPNSPIIGIMDEYGEIAKYAVSKYKNDVQFIPLYKYIKGLNNCGDVDPFEWIDIIYSLHGLLTSYFHGMCLAINANIPFRVFEYREKIELAQSKSYDLLYRYKRTDMYYKMDQGVGYKKMIDDFVLGIIHRNIDEDNSDIKLSEEKKYNVFFSHLFTLINNDERN